MIELLNLIPIRHPEKIAKRELIFYINENKLVYWKDIEDSVIKLRSSIKQSVTKKEQLEWKLN